MPQLAVYRGPFEEAHAERLLWRAGFGPRPGEAAAALAKLGLDGAVRSLARPGREKLVGPAPTDDKGRPLAPYDAWGHDHVWWLDRMVRTSRPLVERMALVWHDWFATAIVELANFGEDPHDLRLQRRGPRHVAGIGDVAPGERADLTLRLPPGRYSLWCSVADHRQRGMRATLVVTP